MSVYEEAYLAGVIVAFGVFGIVLLALSIEDTFRRRAQQKATDTLGHQAPAHA